MRFRTVGMLLLGMIATADFAAAQTAPTPPAFAAMPPRFRSSLRCSARPLLPNPALVKIRVIIEPRGIIGRVNEARAVGVGRIVAVGV